MIRNNDKYHCILEAAVKVFARNGFHQATVSQIAKQAGVADGTIYLYFKNKDDILVQFFNYKARQVFERFRGEVDKVENPTQKLRNLIRRHLEEFQNDKDMALVYQTETRRNSPLVAEQIKEMAKTYLDIVAEIIEKGQEEGIMRKDLYMWLAKRFVLGAVEEIISTWLHSGGKYEMTSMVDPMVDLLMDGIGADTAKA